MNCRVPEAHLEAGRSIETLPPVPVHVEAVFRQDDVLSPPLHRRVQAEQSRGVYRQDRGGDDGLFVADETQ